MRLVPEKFRPPLSLAAVDNVFLVHFIENDVDAVTFTIPDGSMVPKFSMPGGDVTLHWPTTVADGVSEFDPAPNAAGANNVAHAPRAARIRAFIEPNQSHIAYGLTVIVTVSA
jgi:hypothetical protein